MTGPHFKIEIIIDIEFLKALRASIPIAMNQE